MKMNDVRHWIDNDNICEPENIEFLKDSMGAEFFTYFDKGGMTTGILRATAHSSYNSVNDMICFLCERGIVYDDAKEIIAGTKRLMTVGENNVVMKDDWKAPDVEGKVAEVKDFIKFVKEMDFVTDDKKLQLEFLLYVTICNFIEGELKVNEQLAINHYEVINEVVRMKIDGLIFQ